MDDENTVKSNNFIINHYASFGSVSTKLFEEVMDLNIVIQF
jgi:hypothetical protein